MILIRIDSVSRNKNLPEECNAVFCHTCIHKFSRSSFSSNLRVWVMMNHNDSQHGGTFEYFIDRIEAHFITIVFFSFFLFFNCSSARIQLRWITDWYCSNSNTFSYTVWYFPHQPFWGNHKENVFNQFSRNLFDWQKEFSLIYILNNSYFFLLFLLEMFKSISLSHLDWTIERKYIHCIVFWINDNVIWWWRWILERTGNEKWEARRWVFSRIRIYTAIAYRVAPRRANCT